METPLQAAIREAKEETGIENLKIFNWNENIDVPIFIETHLIPQNSKKQEKEHFHYDFMYVFETSQNEIILAQDEVSEFKWVEIEKILEKNPESYLGKSLKRLIDMKLI